MKTLNKNYQKNVEIMSKNLSRGLSEQQAIDIISHFENQFKENNLYKKDEKSFIKELKRIVLCHFTKIDIQVIE